MAGLKSSQVLAVWRKAKTDRRLNADDRKLLASIAREGKVANPSSLGLSRAKYLAALSRLTPDYIPPKG